MDANRRSCGQVVEQREGKQAEDGPATIPEQRRQIHAPERARDREKRPCDQVEAVGCANGLNEREILDEPVGKPDVVPPLIDEQLRSETEREEKEQTEEPCREASPSLSAQERREQKGQRDDSKVGNRTGLAVHPVGRASDHRRAQVVRVRLHERQEVGGLAAGYAVDGRFERPKRHDVRQDERAHEQQASAHEMSRGRPERALGNAPAEPCLADEENSDGQRRHDEEMRSRQQRRGECQRREPRAAWAPFAPGVKQAEKNERNESRVPQIRMMERRRHPEGIEREKGAREPGGNSRPYDVVREREHAESTEEGEEQRHQVVPGNRSEERAQRIATATDVQLMLWYVRSTPLG